MVGKALWQNLKDLVDFDKKIFKLKEDIDIATKTLNEDSYQISKLTTSLDAKKNLCLHLQKGIDALELDSKTFEMVEKDKIDKLENVKNQKEYKSLETELEHARKNRINLENKITEGWYQLEQAKNEHENEKNRVIQQEEQLVRDVQAKQTLIQDLSVQLNKLQEERLSFSSQIPEEWLVKYERMKHNVEDPIVPVINGSCSACYYSILYQDLIKLKKSSVLPCRNCYRFLYYDEEEEKALTQAKF